MDDPKAVYLTAETFGARGDGVADDSAAIQSAIDKAVASSSYGIVFVPEGRYRLTRTVNVWASVRVIGTPGYGDPDADAARATPAPGRSTRR
jgi:hypothetical protein